MSSVRGLHDGIPDIAADAGWNEGNDKRNGMRLAQQPIDHFAVCRISPIGDSSMHPVFSVDMEELGVSHEARVSFIGVPTIGNGAAVLDLVVQHKLQCSANDSIAVDYKQCFPGPRPWLFRLAI